MVATHHLTKGIFTCPNSAFLVGGCRGTELPNASFLIVMRKNTNWRANVFFYLRKAADQDRVDWIGRRCCSLSKVNGPFQPSVESAGGGQCRPVGSIAVRWSLFPVPTTAENVSQKKGDKNRRWELVKVVSWIRKNGSCLACWYLSHTSGCAYACNASSVPTESTVLLWLWRWIYMAALLGRRCCKQAALEYARRDWLFVYYRALVTSLSRIVP